MTMDASIISCHVVCGGWHRVSEINYMYFQKRKLNIARVKLDSHGVSHGDNLGDGH